MNQLCNAYDIAVGTVTAQSRNDRRRFRANDRYTLVSSATNYSHKFYKALAINIESLYSLYRQELYEQQSTMMSIFFLNR